MPEDAIVRRVLAGTARTELLVLGGAHDLSDNVPDDCEYIRVAVKAYRKVSQ
jgi:hypothetical protein